MGRCYEFGVAIVDGCEHAMVVADEGGQCVCSHCGAECPGRFAACESIVAQPGYVPISAPRWAIPGAVAVRTTVVEVPSVDAEAKGSITALPTSAATAPQRTDSATWALGRELSAIRTLVQHVIDRQRESLPPVGVFDLMTDLLSEAVGRDTAAAVTLDRIEQGAGTQGRQLASLEAAVESLGALGEAQHGALRRIESHVATLVTTIETLDHRIATLEAIDAGSAAHAAQRAGGDPARAAAPETQDDPLDDLIVAGPTSGGGSTHDVDPGPSARTDDSPPPEVDLERDPGADVGPDGGEGLADDAEDDPSSMGGLGTFLRRRT